MGSPSPLCPELHASVFLSWTSRDLCSPAFPKLLRPRLWRLFHRALGPRPSSVAFSGVPFAPQTLSVSHGQVCEWAFPSVPGLPSYHLPRNTGGFPHLRLRAVGHEAGTTSVSRFVSSRERSLRGLPGPQADVLCSGWFHAALERIPRVYEHSRMPSPQVFIVTCLCFWCICGK